MKLPNMGLLKIRRKSKMKIRNKLLLSFLLIVVLFIGAGIVATMNTMKMTELQKKVALQIDIANNAAGYQQGIYEKQFGAFVYGLGNSQMGAELIESSEANHIEPSEDYLFAALANDQELYSKFNDAFQVEEIQIGNLTDEIQVLADGNSSTKFEQISEKLNALNTGVNAVDEKLVVFKAAADAKAQSAVSESENYANMSNMAAIGSFVVMGAASVALAVFMGNRITRPLKKLSEIAGKVSMGDIDQKIDVKTGDEIDDLAGSFQRMINAFKMTEALSKETDA
jgi:HAMP domain-containing protein